MTIIVRLFANLREAAGQGQVELQDVKNVASMLEELTKKFGDELAKQLYEPNTNNLRKTINILINGRSITLPEELEKPLKSDDIVSIFPPVAGG